MCCLFIVKINVCYVPIVVDLHTVLSALFVMLSHVERYVFFGSVVY